MERLVLSVVAPVYREASLLERTFKSLQTFAGEERKRGASVEAVFVDDGSPDNSPRMLAAFASSADFPVQVIALSKNEGKGFAVKTGMAKARGDFVLMTDADLSAPLPEWRKLKAAIDAGADLACGSRVAQGAEIGVAPPLHRRLLGKLFRILVRLSGVSSVRDTQCGFKLFTRESAQKLFPLLRIRRFAFDVELIALAETMGMKIAEIPVRWDYGGSSTVRVISSGCGMLRDLAMLSLRRNLRRKTGR